MAVTGALVAESLVRGATLEGVSLTARKIFRADVGDVDVGQPLTWTFIEFELPDDEVEALMTTLERVLDPLLGWYCDFHSEHEKFVVFASRSFRYPRGDRARRGEAEEYARSVGVPEAQLDWPE